MVLAADLEISAQRADAASLKGPSRQDMGRRVDETLNGSLETRLSSRRGDVLFHATGCHAGLEVHGDLARLKVSK